MTDATLSSLPFPLIARIEDALRLAGPNAFRDLVMILAGSQEVRAIYNAPPPQALPQDWQALSLEQLHDEDIMNHEGLIIAWSGLDALFPSLIPYGPDFYHLRWIFVALEQIPLGMETAHGLARTLWQRHLHNETSPHAPEHWTEARIVQLALPHLMQSRSRTGLMGVVIPHLAALFDESPSHPIQWLYYAQLQKDARSNENPWAAFHPGEGSWTIGMPELKTFGFLPNISSNYLPLRPLLQAAQWQDDLQKTITKLARYAWYRWKRTQEKAWRKRAYTLAAEARSYEDDPTAIVALRPALVFNDFLKSEKALCYQRTPLIHLADDKDSQSKRTVRAIFDLDQPIPSGVYAKTTIGIPLLQEDFHARPDDWIDLRQVLLSAGRKHELARVLWLFARELLPPLPSPEWQKLRATRKLDDAIDELFVALYLYNLLDPWQWRQGRYPIFIERLHETIWRGLKAILAEEESRQDPTRHYTQGLLAWYGGGDCPSLDVPCHIHYMMTHFRRYLDATQDEEPSSAINRRRRQIAQGFIELGRYLLEPNMLQKPRDLADSYPKTPGLYSHLKRLLVETPFSWHVSSFFYQVLTRYHALRKTWQGLRQGAMEGHPPPRRALQKLTQDYKSLQNAYFALRHERDVLNWLFQRDIRQIEELNAALQGRPLLRFQVLNPWIIRDRQEALTLRITNVGAEPAYNFHLEKITFSEPADSLDENPKRAADLDRQGMREWYWRVKAQGEMLTLKLAYAYQDEMGTVYTGEETLNMTVKGRRTQLPLIIDNPYQAGTPVSGANGLFMGREELLRAIFSRLLTGNTQPILLRGPRRMGKTSILHQIQWLMEDWERLQALGFRKEQMPFIQRQVVIKTSLQVVDPAQPDYIRLFFQHILEEIHLQARIPEPFQPERAGLNVFPAVAFQRLLTHWIDAYIQAPIVILLDEWDEVYREAYQGLARNLRAIIEHRQLESVNWVISSTWMMAKEVAQFGSPFYNQTYNLEVGPLAWEPARKLVIEPSERVGVDWQGEAVVAALQHTGQRPYLLQLLCSKAIDHLVQDEVIRQEGVITVDILNRALGEILQDAQSSDQYFGFLWDLDAGPVTGEEQVDAVGHLILWVLSENYPQPLTRTEIMDAIEDTFQKRGFAPLPPDLFEARFQHQMTLLHRIFDAISETGKRYTLSIPLVHTWLRERLSFYGSREELVSYLYHSAWRQFHAGQPQNQGGVSYES